MPESLNVVHDLSTHCFQCHLHQICCMWTSVVIYDNLWQFPRYFLLNRLVHISGKQVTVILCINFYSMWEKVYMNHSFQIPKCTSVTEILYVLNINKTMGNVQKQWLYNKMVRRHCIIFPYMSPMQLHLQKFSKCHLSLFEKVIYFFEGPFEGPIFFELEYSFSPGTDLWCVTSYTE
jgi:hypothetical protein